MYKAIPYTWLMVNIKNILKIRHVISSVFSSVSVCSFPITTFAYVVIAHLWRWSFFCFVVKISSFDNCGMECASMYAEIRYQESIDIGLRRMKYNLLSWQRYTSVIWLNKNNFVQRQTKC